MSVLESKAERWSSKVRKQYKDRGAMRQSEMKVNPDKDKVRQADGEKSKRIGAS